MKDTTLKVWDEYRDIETGAAQLSTIVNILNVLQQQITILQGCVDCNTGGGTEVQIPPGGGWRDDLKCWEWLAGYFEQKRCELIMYISTGDRFEDFRDFQGDSHTPMTMTLEGSAVVKDCNYYINGSAIPKKRFKVSSI